MGNDDHKSCTACNRETLAYILRGKETLKCFLASQNEFYMLRIFEHCTVRCEIQNVINT